MYLLESWQLCKNKVNADFIIYNKHKFDTFNGVIFCKNVIKSQYFFVKNNVDTLLRSVLMSSRYFEKKVVTKSGLYIYLIIKYNKKKC